MRTAAGLGVAGLGYAISAGLNATPTGWPTAVLVAIAALATFAAGASLRPGSASVGAGPLALGALAAARVLSAARGFSLGNTIFAASALVVAAGAAWAAWGLRETEAPGAARGLAVAGLGTGAIGAWLLTLGDLPGALGTAVTAAGFLIAATASASPRPAPQAREA